MLIFMTAELQIRQDGKTALSQGHRFPALQAGAKLELCFYVRRRLEPAPSGGDVAIRYTVPCAPDFHVALLLAMTGRGAASGEGDPADYFMMIRQVSG
jgi:hypothetical protein